MVSLSTSRAGCSSHHQSVPAFLDCSLLSPCSDLLHRRNRDPAFPSVYKKVLCEPFFSLCIVSGTGNLACVIHSLLDLCLLFI